MNTSLSSIDTPKIDWQQIRQQYPAFAQGSYLNTASCGLISRSTQAIPALHYQDLVNSGGQNRMKWMTEIQKTRTRVAASISASESQLALLPSFTIGMNYAAQIFRNKAKRVLLVKGDYPSVYLPWQAAEYHCIWVQAGENGVVRPEVVESQIIRDKPEILAISHVMWHSGFKVNLKALSEICQRHGVYLLIDATQSWCAMHIDVSECPVDMMLASGYKWPGAGFGNAFMYINPDLWAKSKLPVLGHGSIIFKEVPKLDTQHLSPHAMEAGHHAYSNFHVLGQALAERLDMGITQIQQRILDLVAYLKKGLTKIGWTYFSDFDQENQSGIQLIGGDQAVVNHLQEQQVQVIARGKGIRVSIHFYNNESDIDRLIEGLKSFKK